MSFLKQIKKIVHGKMSRHDMQETKINDGVQIFFRAPIRFCRKLVRPRLYRSYTVEGKRFK